MGNAEQKIVEQEHKIERLRSELLTAEAYLSGMKAMLESVGAKPAENSSTALDDKPKRRMRLGAKKRVIYQLVSNGLNSIELIYEKVDGTSIEKSYARDVVRDAISECDMLGAVDGFFILSDTGSEILAKASMPQDWADYESILEDKGSDENQSSEPKQFTEGVSAPSNVDEIDINFDDI